MPKIDKNGCDATTYLQKQGDFFSDCVLLENFMWIDPLINCFTCLKDKEKEDKISTVKLKTLWAPQKPERFICLDSKRMCHFLGDTLEVSHQNNCINSQV